MTAHFLDVTELAGEPVSREQVTRMYQRYVWAVGYAEGRDVLEAACGTGPGLGLLARAAKSFRAGDIAPEMVDRVRGHYRDRVTLDVFDAAHLPVADQSLDAILIFEAIYYLPDPAAFAAEAARALRPGGHVLVATANKDLSDFNPSPHSRAYLNLPELAALFAPHGFTIEAFAGFDVTASSPVQRVLRPVKKLAVSLGLFPKTMAGKQLLKRIVFGKPTPMPAELTDAHGPYEPPVALPAAEIDRRHKVLLAALRKPVHAL